MLFHIANEKYGINNPISKQFETLFSMKKKKQKNLCNKIYEYSCNEYENGFSSLNTSLQLAINIERMQKGNFIYLKWWIAEITFIIMDYAVTRSNLLWWNCFHCIWTCDQPLDFCLQNLGFCVKHLIVWLLRVRKAEKKCVALPCNFLCSLVCSWTSMAWQALISHLPFPCSSPHLMGWL